MDSKLQQYVGSSVKPFVPHRGAMMLLDRLVAIGIEHVACEWSISEENAFLQPGRGVPAYVGIEYMAQAVAVHAGARALADGNPPPLGFLLGTRKFESEVAYLEEGVTYRAECQQIIKGEGGLGSFECCIKSGDKTLARAHLSVLEGLGSIDLNG